MTPLILLLLAQPLPPGHPAGGNQAAPSADELIQKLDSTAGLKERDKPFEIAASLGRLYFGQGRYGDAQLYYRQALAQTEEPRALLAVQKKLVGTRPLPEPASVGCEAKPEATLAQMFAKAKEHVTAKNAVGAVACLKVGLASSMEVDVMYGNSQFLLGDAAGAIATYTRALDTFESNADARYARAATTLDAWGDDLAALGRAKADFEKFLADVPTSPRATNAKRLLARTDEALKAGGLSKLTISAQQVAAIAPQQVNAPNAPRQPGQAPQLTPEMMAAFQNAPRTPEMESNFKKLISDAEEHLAHGRFQDALDAYKQVMPYQPDNARLRAGMAWTMVKLNRQPMADNVWNVATQNPDAVAELGDSLKAKGDAEGAKALWTRLRDSVPSYAPKLEGRL